MIGVVWALLYALVGAYVYGDITPLSASAKALAAMGALVGQIYLTVIITRLVGLHMQQKT